MGHAKPLLGSGLDGMGGGSGGMSAGLHGQYGAESIAADARQGGAEGWGGQCGGRARWERRGTGCDGRV